VPLVTPGEGGGRHVCGAGGVENARDRAAAEVPARSLKSPPIDIR